MTQRECCTQTECDLVLQAGDVPILRGNGRFEVSDSAQVEARDSAHVVAWDSAHVVASQYVAIHQHDSCATISGGVVIVVPPSKTASEWCAFYGVTIVDDVAVLYKAVRDDYRSAHGFLYAAGTTPEAPDWDGGQAECGGGLHVAFHPRAAQEFDREAQRFVACPVALADLAVHPNPVYPHKVKVRRVCAPIYECDASGKPLESNERDSRLGGQVEDETVAPR